MCLKTPTPPVPPAPPMTRNVDDTTDKATANREAERRRRRYAITRIQAQGNGAMQGSDAGGKKDLGA